MDNLLSVIAYNFPVFIWLLFAVVAAEFLTPILFLQFVINVAVQF